MYVSLIQRLLILKIQLFFFYRMGSLFFDGWIISLRDMFWHESVVTYSVHFSPCLLACKCFVNREVCVSLSALCWVVVRVKCFIVIALCRRQRGFTLGLCLSLSFRPPIFVPRSASAPYFFRQDYLTLVVYIHVFIFIHVFYALFACYATLSVM